MIYNLKLFHILLILTACQGCGSVGYMMETEKEFKGQVQIGTGITPVFTMDIAGPIRSCSFAVHKDVEQVTESQKMCDAWMRRESEPEGMRTLRQ